jgi:hypothetical protein
MESWELGDFFVGHAGEITQFDHLGLKWILESKSIHLLMDRQQLVIWARSHQLNLIDIHTRQLPPMTLCAFPAGAVDKDVAHKGSKCLQTSAGPFDKTVGTLRDEGL